MSVCGNAGFDVLFVQEVLYTEGVSEESVLGWFASVEKRLIALERCANCWHTVVRHIFFELVNCLEVNSFSTTHYYKPYLGWLVFASPGQA